ncbi:MULTISPECIES: winged helix DNA-binding domain-containing protein [unclassified Streptomyces]|uniref:winged helix DNA-binding domain-containing protein n=1 Tax=unclassified Streptomyces TaxID=2593676 RepID=UPI000DABCC03|nr:MULTISPECIES: winged helix DNA-binding domain-containing protein [unclassified Streptomyces]PZT77463.1 winged helix DNA-binding domain-containing protein [Streptomyces sp. AC1-42W]PZT78582.1 winged helix DNA-binding domain-containing protein [Streptomyces sp. AC1-42T]
MAVNSKTTTAGAAPVPVLTPRALGRATLERQLLLNRAAMSARDAVTHLVGLQAQNTKPPYYQLLARLQDFRPAELSAPMESREVVRIASLRSTVHTHTADDALTLRPLVQPAVERELTLFRKKLPGVDVDRLRELTRAYVEEAPRTPKEIRALLLAEWPDADPQALTIAARCVLPLVQVTPRGLWGRSGGVALTTADHWLGRAAQAAPDIDATALRYLGAFGPASVRDMQSWAGLTRLKEVFERLRPRLTTFRDEHGVELFDLPDAPRPAEDTPAPPRFLPEFDNVLLGHADRTRIIPAPLKGLNGVGNQNYGSVLVDGFFAAVWRLDTPRDALAALTVQELRPLTAAERDALTREAAGLVTTMTGAAAHDVRFARFIDLGR